MLFRKRVNMAVAIAMGGMALASGVMGALGASSAANAQAQAQEIQQRNVNFQNQWNKMVQDRNALRQYQANLERNAQIEQSANRERALSELYLDKGFSNQKSQLSKQTSQVNAQFISTMAGRNINQSSGTARALLRQNMESLGSNMAALKLNYRSAYNDVVTQQQARLSQRASSMAPDLGVFLPTTTAVVNNSSSALTTGLIQAGLMGASAGIDAGLRYGSPKGDALTITSANSSGSMMGPPNPYL
jgi:hypothetical protein